MKTSINLILIVSLSIIAHIYIGCLSSPKDFVIREEREVVDVIKYKRIEDDKIVYDLETRINQTGGGWFIDFNLEEKRIQSILTYEDRYEKINRIRKRSERGKSTLKSQIIMVLGFAGYGIYELIGNKDEQQYDSNMMGWVWISASGATLYTIGREQFREPRRSVRDTTYSVVVGGEEKVTTQIVPLVHLKFIPTEKSIEPINIRFQDGSARIAIDEITDRYPQRNLGRIVFPDGSENNVTIPSNLHSSIVAHYDSRLLDEINRENKISIEYENISQKYVDILKRNEVNTLRITDMIINRDNRKDYYPIRYRFMADRGRLRLVINVHHSGRDRLREYDKSRNLYSLNISTVFDLIQQFRYGYARFISESRLSYSDQTLLDGLQMYIVYSNDKGSSVLFEIGRDLGWRPNVVVSRDNRRYFVRHITDPRFSASAKMIIFETPVNNLTGIETELRYIHDFFK